MLPDEALLEMSFLAQPSRWLSIRINDRAMLRTLDIWDALNLYLRVSNYFSNSMSEVISEDSAQGVIWRNIPERGREDKVTRLLSTPHFYLPCHVLFDFSMSSSVRTFLVKNHFMA
jgi:hypothetical protein